MGAVLSWGPTVYPVVLDTVGNYPNLIDFTHDVIASHPNSLRDAIFALEAKLGITGGNASGFGSVGFSGIAASPGNNTIWVDSTFAPDHLIYTDSGGADIDLSSGSGSWLRTVAVVNYLSPTNLNDVIRMDNGTLAAPAYSFKSDTDTGIHFDTTGAFGFNSLVLSHTGAANSVAIALNENFAGFINDGAASVLLASRADVHGAAQNIGAFQFYGMNSTPASYEFGKINLYVLDHTAASEDSRMDFYIAIAGVSTNILRLSTTDVTINSGLIVAGLTTQLVDIDVGAITVDATDGDIDITATKITAGGSNLRLSSVTSVVGQDAIADFRSVVGSGTGQALTNVYAESTNVGDAIVTVRADNTVGAGDSTINIIAHSINPGVAVLTLQTVEPSTGGYMHFDSDGEMRFTDKYFNTSGPPGWANAYVKLSAASAEWDTFDTNFGNDVSLVAAINTSYTAATGSWVLAENLDVDTGTETVDSFVATQDGGCMWIVHVSKAANVRSSLVHCSWDFTANAVTFDWVSTLDIGDTSDLVLNVVMAASTVTLQAIAASDDWIVKVRRSPLAE